MSQPTDKLDGVLRSLANKIPKSWIYGLIAVIGLAGAFVGWRFIKNFESGIRNSAIAECNAVQLEEELKAAKKEAAEAVKQSEFWKAKAAEQVIQIQERVVFRDRVKRELVEVQVGLVGEDVIREQISPTTQRYLDLVEEEYP